MSRTIGILKLGVGNVHAIQCAIDILGFENRFVSREACLDDLAAVVVPGVSHFDELYERLSNINFSKFLESVLFGERNTKVLGICSGFHVLCAGSEETERGYRGFGVFDFDVTRLRSLTNSKPTTHNSWRVISQVGEFDKRMYFNHSFGVEFQDGNNIETLFLNDLGNISIAAKMGDVSGVQFHPEKSGRDGLNYLNRFCSEAVSTASD